MDAHSFNYNSLQPSVASKQMLNKMSVQIRYQKNNVALFALFQTIPSDKQKIPKRFAVATTHAYWDPKHSDLKLRQAHMLLQELQHYVKRTGNGTSTPVIVCGDFNAMPDSAMYELYSKGRVAGMK